MVNKRPICHGVKHCSKVGRSLIAFCIVSERRVAPGEVFHLVAKEWIWINRKLFSKRPNGEFGVLYEDEVKSASQAELKDMSHNRFQKRFDDVYQR
ncbi:hypothetical protein TNCV_4254181 [Trichonephila clavipes]|nr:hypothetical protein TNCV_4254181 [Trichonephila clavipes]